MVDMGLKYKIKISKAPKDEERMYVAFLSNGTRKLLDINIGEKLHLIGKNKNILLEIESDIKCQDDFIYINNRIRSELGNKLSESIYIEKPSKFTKFKFTIKENIKGFILGLIIGIVSGFIANWAWHIYS